MPETSTTDAQVRPASRALLTLVSVLLSVFAGTFYFCVSMLLSWVLGKPLHGLLLGISSYIDYLVWDAWGDAKFPFHLVVDIVLIALSWIVFLVGWLCYGVAPLMALVAFIAIGVGTGSVMSAGANETSVRGMAIRVRDTLSNSRTAQRQELNESKVAQSSLLASMAALATGALCAILVSPMLQESVFGRSGWTFIRLEELCFRSTLFTWIVIAAGLILSVPAAIAQCREGQQKGANEAGSSSNPRAPTSPRRPAVSAGSGAQALAALLNQMDDQGAVNFAELLNQVGSSSGNTETDPASSSDPQAVSCPSPESHPQIPGSKSAEQSVETSGTSARQSDGVPAALVQFACHNCGKKVRARVAHAGKNVQCPRCQQILTIPQA